MTPDLGLYGFSEVRKIAQAQLKVRNSQCVFKKSHTLSLLLSFVGN